MRRASRIPEPLMERSHGPSATVSGASLQSAIDFDLDGRRVWGVFVDEDMVKVRGGRPGSGWPTSQS